MIKSIVENFLSGCFLASVILFAFKSGQVYQTYTQYKDVPCAEINLNVFGYKIFLKEADFSCKRKVYDA